MIQTLTTYESITTDPYQNLAVEEYLTFHTEPGRVHLILMAKCTYRCDRTKSELLEGVPCIGTGSRRRTSGPPPLRRGSRLP